MGVLHVCYATVNFPAGWQSVTNVQTGRCESVKFDSDLLRFSPEE
jgi:hypothetical protein